MEIPHTTLASILLVEDDPSDVELTLAALDLHQLANRVTVVGNGAEAIDYLYRRGKYESRVSGNPMVILLDNKMPKMSGLEVLKIIKADRDLQTIPVVALTSSRETPDLAEFYRWGANAYVVKPVDFAEFMAAISQLGSFWAVVNEPPNAIWKEELKKPGPAGTPPAIEVPIDETTPAHSASGR